MPDQNKQARDDADYYHFDIHGFRNAGFSTFNHDYVPQLAPIKANLAQDLPQSAKDFSPGTLTSVVDPYLPIAELRKQFGGKGRKLSGYIILLRGLRVKNANGKRYDDLNNVPSWNRLTMGVHSVGTLGTSLPEVHPFAVFHLNYCLAYFERRLNFHKTVRLFEGAIKNAPSVEVREEEVEAFQDFTSFAQTDVDVGERADFEAILDGFPKPAQQRQVAMPADTVRIPGSPELQWVDLEGAIKRHMEDMMVHGFVAVDDVCVMACDDLGAYTVGVGKDAFHTVTWTNYGNIAYWANLHFSILNCLHNWLPSTDESFAEFRNMVHDRYGMWLEEYFARDLSDDWKTWFNQDSLDWMAGIRADYLEQVALDKKKNL